jgi:hypothetical protein
MMYLSIALYLLGTMMVLTFLEPEEGYEKDLKILAALWPLFTILALAQELAGGRDKE